ncbi:MAG: GNAT family N-acetyltransferase [Phycisphaeraceae bacterium]|nr:GNAT family N-acetyltransferase [Phycisphaeraceae bacterium]
MGSSATSASLRMSREDMFSVRTVGLPATYTLRAFRPGDEVVWKRLCEAAEAEGAAASAACVYPFDADTAASARRVLFLCDEQGVEIACVGCWFDQNHHGKPHGSIRWLAVARSHQGRKLGAPLLSAGCQLIKEMGYPHVVAEVDPDRRAAIALLLSFGFVPDAADIEQDQAWQTILKDMNRPLRIIKRYEPRPWPDDFSPSFVHHKLIRRRKPRLSYDGGDIAAWRRKLRRRVAELTGYDRMPTKRPPLRVRSLWEREHPLGTIQKLVMTCEEGSDMPAYLCLPRNAKPPYTPFICMQGHSTGSHNSIALDLRANTQPIHVPGDRDFGLGAMRRGVAALCVEQRAFGERAELLQRQRFPHNACHDAAMRAMMLGRTLLAERTYDVDRAIDYLATRSDMDMSRLGVMGNSGGGMVSVYAAALLDRVRAAMPSCGFCTFVDSILSIYHCADNYVPGLYLEAEMGDVLGLFAPRPLAVVAGRHDPIFPLRGVQAAFKKVKAIYRAAGAPSNCRLVIGDGAHRFYADDAWPVMLDLLDQPAKSTKKHNKSRSRASA